MEIYMTHEEKIIEHLKTEKMLSVGELDCLLTTEDTETVEKLKAEARMAAQSVYGKQIYIRGLIEFTNYCKMTAITAASAEAMHVPSATASQRSRSSSAARQGMSLDSAPLSCRAEKTPILQMRKICGLVSAIKRAYPDCAVTLSIGEKERASYQAYFDAGADRYLLRHETADAVHYGKPRTRRKCPLKTGCAVCGI